MLSQEFCFPGIQGGLLFERGFQTGCHSAIHVNEGPELVEVSRLLAGTLIAGLLGFLICGVSWLEIAHFVCLFRPEPDGWNEGRGPW